MDARLESLVVIAWCDRCNSQSSYQGRDANREYGYTDWSYRPEPDGPGIHIMYRLFRCPGCGRGAVAEIESSVPQAGSGAVVAFHPISIRTAALPTTTPTDIEAEFREAERCAAAGAFRGGTAMLRSALEKTLKANGYTSGTLEKKIDQAAADGAITAARKQRAHDNVRVLGNEVVHDAWRPVTEEEFSEAHGYTQRVVEDFYEHRAEVEAVLRAAKRIP